MPTYLAISRTPIGDLTLTGDDRALTGIHFEGRVRALADAIADRAPLVGALLQLDEYFAGERATFDLVLRPEGTQFQRAVWDAVAAIPYGASRSYGEVAGVLGRPAAARAVGHANGRNPLPIVIPCHRVVGSTGGLTGYGGGLERKRWLLEHEAATI